MRKPPDPLSDTDLALRAQEGDESAFEELYDRHAAGVARMLSSFAGTDRTAIDDLTQDVFFRVVDNLSSYVPRRPFPHWLYTIALNVGRNHVRGRAKVVPIDPAELESVIGERGGRELSREVLGSAAVNLVRRLPEGMREVVALRIGGGFSFVEISGILGIPEGTARSRMHHALRILREGLQVPIRKGNP